MIATERFHAGRLAGLLTLRGGDRLRRDNYFSDPEGALDTEEQLDWYAGATSVGCYRETLDELTLEHGVDVVYAICRLYAHGTRHYEQGWDVLVECTEPGEILAILLTLPDNYTVNDAVRAVADALCLEVYNDQRNDARGAGGLPITNFDVGV